MTRIRCAHACWIAIVVCSSANVSAQEPAVLESDRDHWSFLPLSVDVPQTADPSVRNAIDAFIHKRLEDEGLRPLGEADRFTLLRRVTFDLTGLPPTPDEIDDFTRDTRPDAFERVVDRLLASPAHGERAAQHWLDLARFAETDGFEHDHVRPNAWRYRDWVIQALNSDMPYDEFVRLQLAGDLIRPDDTSAVIATGFLLCGPDMPDINLKEERRHNFLNDMTSTVSSVFLGLQLGCAQCHDHKYDPVSIHDFYRFRAFFEGVDIFRDHALVLGESGRSKQQKMLGRVVREGKPRTAWVRTRGDFRRQGDQVSPAVPRVLTRTHDRPASRTELGDWITDPENSIARRVIANRVWQQHFGVGLAPTESDFGIVGDEPEYPDLLDWLAAELPARGWSLKQLRREIVTSAAYRRSISLKPGPLEQQDPDNALLGRRTPRRLDGESLRDAMLRAAGSLNRTPGGPGVRPPLPREIVSTVLKNHWPVSEHKPDHNRRSIYLFVRRNLRYPFFDAFDRPDSNASCARRNQSTTALQALVLLNSEFTLKCAQQIAARDQSHEELYRLLFGRELNDADRSHIRHFLETGGDREPYLLPLALLNANEFLWID